MKTILIFIFFLSSLLFPGFASAQNEIKFSTFTAVNYKVAADGRTTVENAITLENLYSDYYVTSYSLIVAGTDPKTINAFDAAGKLPSEVIKRDDSHHEIKVNFPESVVGVGQKRQFSVSYIDPVIATKTGEVWEVEIPKVAGEQFQNYTATLSVPLTLGEVAFISPQPSSRETVNGVNVFRYSSSGALANGISAAFGQFQVFSFDLTYHLENPVARSGVVDIAIPPDTAYQKVILSNIDPKPNTLYKDTDGNWLAQYILKPRERVDVKAVGAVQLFSAPVSSFVVNQEALQSNLLESQYWQASDPEIQRLGRELKTPRAIYDYVVNTLSYDYDRVKPNITRLGALEALKNPTNAICMEFTDLFVAISRAAGIPAREINGYAYAENPEIQPLSLVADVLHSWAEYWDAEREVWVPVDPTWGSTTGGVDFFTKLDLRHFTFVIHGKDAREPYPPGSYKLGPNPQKDVFVSFGSLPQNRDPKLTSSVASQTSSIFQDMEVVVRLINEGTSASYGNVAEVYFDGKKVESRTIDSLLPSGHEDLKITIPVNFLGQNMPDKVSVLFANQELVVPTHREIVIISNLSLVFLIVFVLLLLALFKLGKLKLPKVQWKLTKIWKPKIPKT